ncbi:hypothetical protein ACRAWF_13475 [Streptomyces sp. L7]
MLTHLIPEACTSVRTRNNPMVNAIDSTAVSIPTGKPPCTATETPAPTRYPDSQPRPEPNS